MQKQNNGLREIKFTKDYTKHAEGSVLVEFGDTKVICTASIEDKVPPFLKNSGTGWISAEYSMLPRSTHQRKIRESSRGKVDGRTHEIQRLIGRSLRSVIDLKQLGEKTIWIDCDVIQADGGTRTASISGAFVALALACDRLCRSKQLKKFPIKEFVSAVSVGIVDGDCVLDLCYEQDSSAHVDMNVVMTGKGEFIEIQSTGEERPFTRTQFNSLLELAEGGCMQIIDIQKQVLGAEITDRIHGIQPKPQAPKKERVKHDNTPYLNAEGKLEFVIASSNSHKIEEINAILAEHDIKLLSLDDVGLKGIEIEETGVTFEENAMIKAKAIMELTGKIAIADDSGLMVDVLGGEPGVYSARSSGADAHDQRNNQLLKQKLADINWNDRKARFVSVIALAFPDGREGLYKGTCEGMIGFEESGENGFGYDPLFIPDIGPDNEKTFAELSAEEKNRISHRSRALKVMSRKLEDLLY